MQQRLLAARNYNTVRAVTRLSMANPTPSAANFSSWQRLAPFARMQSVQKPVPMGNSWDDQSSLLQRFSSIWMAQEGGPEKDEESKGRGRKLPSGFEKIFKRTRRGITHEEKDKEPTEKKENDEDKKASEEEKKEE